MIKSLRMQATKATILRFPVAVRRVYMSSTTGFGRMAHRMGINNAVRARGTSAANGSLSAKRTGIMGEWRQTCEAGHGASGHSSQFRQSHQQLRGQDHGDAGHGLQALHGRQKFRVLLHKTRNYPAPSFCPTAKRFGICKPYSGGRRRPIRCSKISCCRKKPPLCGNRLY